MPTIAMSDDFFNGSAGGFVSRLMNWNNTATPQAPVADARAMAAVAGLLSGSNTAFGIRAIYQIYIMKGVVPVDFTNMHLFSTRSADVLVTFSTMSGNTSAIPTAQDFSPSEAGVGKHPVKINTNYVFATQSGTATWFWWALRAVNPSTTTLSNNVDNQIIGTVGIPGSGADLEIPNVSIAAGQAYRIRNLTLSFPQSWSW